MTPLSSGDCEGREPLHLRLCFVSLVTLFLVALFLFAGWILYSLAGKPSTDFYQKLSELSLQLAVIVVIGGAVKAIADSREREKEAIEEQSKQREESAQPPRDARADQTCGRTS